MKIPKPKRLPSGSWHLHMVLGGECISITRKTKDECIADAQCIKADYLAGKRFQSNRKAVEKTLKEIQEEFVKANRPVLSPSTVRSYEAYIKSRWKNWQNRRIKDIKWQDMINEELKAVSPKTAIKKDKPPKTISPKTVKNAWALVSASLKHAGIAVPEIRLAPCPVNDVPFLQPDEILKFCETIKGRPFETAALLMLHGLRLSEVLGLQWKNIDTERNLISIRGAMARGPDGQTMKTTNKNQTSSRTLPIMIPRLSELLKADKTGKAPDDYIVKTHPSNLYDDVKRACRDAGITETSCHGLRHSFASLCYRIPGVSERQVMQWGGWSNIQTMHKIYIRIAAKDESEAAKAVRNFYLKQGKTETKIETKSKNPVK